MSWEEVKLGDLFEITSGGTPSRDNPNFFGGSIPWFKTGDLKSSRLSNAEEFITQEALDSSSAKLFPKDTVLFAMYGATIGAAGILTIEAATNQACAAFLPSKQVSPEFLYYFFLHNKQQFINRGVGGAQPNLSGRLLKDIKIPLPPLPIQKKIAAVLEKADELRRKREEQIKRLDDLLQATFLDMFGDPVTNPKEWDVVKLGEISHKITDGVHAKPNYTTEGKPFISVVNIKSGKIIFDNCKFVSEEDFKIFTKVNKPEFGDILYTKVGATYGIPAFVDVHEDFCLYVSVSLIKPNHDLINSRFLAVSMGMPYVKRQADSRIKGIGVPDLHLNQIREFDICCPPTALQQKFVDFCIKIDEQKTHLGKLLEGQNNLFNSLMQRAFKGELDLV